MTMISLWAPVLQSLPPGLWGFVVFMLLPSASSDRLIYRARGPPGSRGGGGGVTSSPRDESSEESPTLTATLNTTRLMKHRPVKYSTNMQLQRGKGVFSSFTVDVRGGWEIDCCGVTTTHRGLQLRDVSSRCIINSLKTLWRTAGGLSVSADGSFKSSVVMPPRLKNTGLVDHFQQRRWTDEEV